MQSVPHQVPSHHKNMPIFVMIKGNHEQNTLKNIACGYSFEPPRRGGSNEYLQSMF